MEPVITAIAAAVALGAAEGLKSIVPQAVSDAYAGLKKLIQDRYGKQEYLIDAVDYLTKKPEAAPRRQMLEAALKEAGADKDQELHQLAQQLLAALKEQPGSKKPEEPKVEQHITGHGNVVAGTGDVTAGDINITL